MSERQVSKRGKGIRAITKNRNSDRMDSASVLKSAERRLNWKQKTSNENIKVHV